jgi:hypothetical protein
MSVSTPDHGGLPEPDGAREIPAQQAEPLGTILFGKGDKGDKGERGEAGESLLIPIAEAMVARLVRAKAVPKWVAYLQGAVIAVLIAVIVILSAWVIPSLHHYVNTVVQHECQALELLTKTPVSPPANPAKNPSRVADYKFYQAVLVWKHEDGCAP